MSKQEYDSFLDVVKSSLLRSGVITDAEEDSITPAYLEAFSPLVEISMEDGGSPILDIATHQVNYRETLRTKLFEEYLEYKKVSESITIPEWLSRKVDKAFDTFDVSYSDMRKVVAGVYEPAINPGITDEAVERSAGVGRADFKTYGVDEDGYDLWLPPAQGTAVEDFESTEPVEKVKPLFNEDNPAPAREDDLLTALGLSLNEEDYTSAPTDYAVEAEGMGDIFTEADPLGTLYSEPIDIDDDGYDVWADSGLGAVDTGIEGVFVGFVYGEDSDGYDIWVKPEGGDGFEAVDSAIAGALEDGVFTGKVVGEDEDGYDIWELDSGDSLGEMVGRVVGEDKDGYDIWSLEDEPAEESEVGSEEEPGSLGTLVGRVVGEDKDGYDIWSLEDEDEDGSEEADSEDSEGDESEGPEHPGTAEEPTNPFQTPNFGDSDENPFFSALNQEESPFPPPGMGTAPMGRTPFADVEEVKAPKQGETVQETLADIEAIERTANLAHNLFSRFGRH